MHSLHQVLSDTAVRAPKSIAIDYGGSRVTYAELDERSSQLAGALRELGVRTGNRVGVLLGKSIDAYAAIFGILKTGAVFVPLDLRFPPRRVEEIVRRSGMKLLITDREQLARLPSITCQLAVVDGATGTSVATDDRMVHALDMLLKEAERVPALAGDNDLAYILFTSGSTGAPKGVAISHRAALWFVEWAVATFHLGPEDRILHVAPFIFDLSVLDIYATMHAGGTIVPLPDGYAMFPVRVGETLAAQRITTVYVTPSQLRLLVTRGTLEQRDVSALRRVLVAGEVLDVSLAKDLFRSLPDVTCYNLYGPTETNVCTMCVVDARTLESTHEIPIGRPCSGCEVLLADDSGREVEEHEIGEIAVNSPGVMTGYWRNSKGTRRVLRAMSARPNANAIFYRTGDLAVRDQEGNLLFRGRRDRQIKYRGYRIELEEIETALRSHPEVTDALAVLATGGCRATDSRLVAYARLRRPGSVSARELSKTCTELLPRFMIPEEIVTCDELPLSLSGKRVRVVPHDARPGEE